MKDEALISEDVNVIELIDKIEQLVTYSEICLQNVIPSLVNISSLNNANSQITNVQNELNSYISNKSIGHLNNAVSHVDAVMVQLNSLPIPRPHLSEESFSNSLVQFKKLVESSFKEIKELKDQLESSISEVSSSSIAQKDDVENLASIVGQHKENIEHQITEFNERLVSTISEGKEELASNINEQKEEFDAQLEKQRNSGNGVISSLEENKKQASDLVQIIGNIGITGNYQKIANQEKESADKWRNIALFLMIGMVVIIGITIGISTANGFEWKLALFRIGAALVWVFRLPMQLKSQQIIGC